MQYRDHSTFTQQQNQGQRDFGRTKGITYNEFQQSIPQSAQSDFLSAEK